MTHAFSTKRPAGVRLHIWSHLTRLTRVLPLLALVLCLSGCKEAKEVPPRGELILALQTDMSLPKDVNRVRVQVSVGGKPSHDNTYIISPTGKEKLPGTITIVAPVDDPSPSVDIRVIGVREREARVFTRVLTTIQPHKSKLLHIPIQWLCDDSVIQEGSSTFESTCSAKNGEQRTCRAGTCVSAKVDSKKLPDFDPREVFGGGRRATDSSGICFATERCLDAGFDLTPDEDCRVQVEVEEGERLNFGLVIPEDGDGLCGDKGCYIPLDEDELFGWEELDASEGGRTAEVQLPPAVCDRIEEGKVLAVRGSKACETKTRKYPTCGPWSSVDDAPGATEEPDSGVIPPASTEEQSDAGTGTPPGMLQTQAPELVGTQLDAPIQVDAKVQLELSIDGMTGDAGLTEVEWRSDNDDVATVNAQGEVTAVSVGTATIVAVVGGSLEEFTITVAPARPLRVELRLADTTVVVGTTVDYVIIGVYADDSERVEVGTVSSTEEGILSSLDGTLSGLAAGDAEVFASVDGLESERVTVAVVLRMLEAIEVSEDATAPRMPGSTQLRAIGNYNDDTSEDITDQVNWSSTDPSVVQVSPEGRAEAQDEGNARIVAELDGIQGDKPFVISNCPATMPTVGGPCSTAGICSYGGMDCTCDVSGTDAGTGVWTCSTQ